MKTWLIGILIILVIGSIVAYNKIFSNSTKKEKAGGNNPSQQINIQGFVAREKKISNNVVASGTLLPAEQIELHPEVSGRIILLSINEGKVVAKGALLLKLNSSDLEAQYNKLLIQKENQAKIVERTKKLLEVDNISQQDYDQATTTLNGMLSDLALMRAQILKTEIRAPFSGVVGLRNVSLGAYIDPSTIIAKLQQTNPLKIDFSVPEKYSALVNEGDAVTFEVDGFTEKFTGKIYALEPGIDALTRSLKIRALVNNPSSKLHPGAFAKVNLNLADVKGIMVPSQAVIPQTRGKKVVVSKNGKAVFQTVETGMRDENNIQVLSGISEGDTVVTTGLLFVKPEQALKFTKVN